jgi:hypothetical protein
VSAPIGDGNVRMTVVLLPKVAGDLAVAAALTGDTKTDTFNRSISLYAAVMAAVELGAGNRLDFIHADGSVLRLKISRPRRWWWSR